MKALDIGLGHLYFDVLRNEQMIEFHIDYWNQHKQPAGKGAAPAKDFDDN